MIPPFFFQKGQLRITGKNLAVMGSLMLVIALQQSPAFAQLKSNSPGRQAMDSTNRIAIHQEIHFKVSPSRLYAALLSSKEFSASTKLSFEDFTATSANIDSALGGTFSLFDGHIVGRILELVPDERIVEAWRIVDWPPGAYSIARFELRPQGTGTQLIFDHIGFPDGLKEHLALGWQQHYWDALAKYLQ